MSLNASPLFRAVLASVFGLAGLAAAHAQDRPSYPAAKPAAPAAQAAPAPAMPFNIQLPPTRPKENAVPNTMRESISPEARANFIGSLMSINPFSMQEMIAMMAVKYPAKEGLSFDDVVESMKSKANEINFKYVGSNPLSKEIAAVTGKPTPRVEFHSFCDALIARELLDLSLEFAIFLPCRIAVVEDANKKIWVLTLDWDVRWLDSSKNPNQISAKLRDGAIKIRQAMDTIMRAGAEGAF